LPAVSRARIEANIGFNLGYVRDKRLQYLGVEGCKADGPFHDAAIPILDGVLAMALPAFES